MYKYFVYQNKAVGATQKSMAVIFVVFYKDTHNQIQNPII